MAKAFKSAEFVDTDSDSIMEFSSSSSESDSDESSGSTAVAERALLRARVSTEIFVSFFGDFAELFEGNSCTVELRVDSGIVDSNKAVS